ncbi:unnamed protein product [Didymodactylos carnosus]|uniref:Uncharacterized protein n=1 Tax=Didymodactylos carnosus TaxID=1234261 RepID=A0A813VXJ2_9BILA|nr:unnamed protein product [Didymodactylos carnosus]CAF1422431.1 unnamed protein product [Didymodactylos carnosus]CAF3637217.1 unnamed protein product [Didymodactylos carnosus]CAF4222698.1 unnamed protein product [Didymodactylos carnosus]
MLGRSHIDIFKIVLQRLKACHPQADLQTLEDDFEDINMAIEELKILENIYTDAKKTLESSSSTMNQE